MLFFISFVLIFLSSYITANLLTKKAYEHFTYLLLIAFSQIVLSFEILSLFKAICARNVVISNVIVLIISLLIWMLKGQPKYFINIKPFYDKFKNSLKLDKLLIVAFLGFIVLISGAVFLNCICPVANADASDYHLARSVWYIIQGSLNHFGVADARAIIFPINSEILYAWVLLLIKKDVFLGFISFFGFILCITSIYKIMRFIKFSMRQILWCIFVLSSFASVIVQISGTETDILTGSLILSSITLFWISLKEKTLTPLIMSSLAYALAIGTKTTAIIAIPAISIILIYLSVKFKNYKNLLYFISFGFLNFLIFGAYNYILNFIQFGNVMGVTSSIVVHKNFYGLKGMVASTIRHFFLFFDFAGFKWSEYIGGYIIKVKDVLLNISHVSNVPEGVYSNPLGKFGINNLLFEPSMGLGVLGFAVYLPCLIWALVQPTFKRNEKIIALGIFATSFIIFILTLSSLLAYMNFSIRFITMFVIITSPVLAYSYFRKNNIFKTITLLFMLYYMVLVSTHIWARPIWSIFKSYIYNGETISDTRQRILCSNYYTPKNVILNQDCAFWLNMEKNMDLQNKKILYLLPSSSNIMIPGMLNLQKNAKIDLGLIYNYPNLNLDKYDYIVLKERFQYTTLVPKQLLKTNYKVDNHNHKLRIQKKAPYYCMLKTINGVIYDATITSKNLKSYPFAAECFFDEDTYKKHDFEPVGNYLDLFYLYKKF